MRAASRLTGSHPGRRLQQEQFSAQVHRCSTDYIGPEHILVGLMREEGGLAARVRTLVVRMGREPDRPLAAVTRGPVDSADPNTYGV
ncbi:MAG: Clp protease N-terminal domain-containing protein [Actinomycetota bacterium]|nr:Clp protease N-terminal domain-containing protein [Actinomycetota bacterium]